MPRLQSVSWTTSLKACIIQRTVLATWERNLGDVMAPTAKYNRDVWTNDNWRRLTLELMAVLEKMKFGCLNTWNTAVAMVLLQHRGTAIMVAMTWYLNTTQRKVLLMSR